MQRATTTTNEIMEEPKIEDVLLKIYDLYENPDVLAKESASKWLADFQKSVSKQSAGKQDHSN